MVAHKSEWTLRYGPPVQTTVLFAEGLYRPAKTLVEKRRANGNRLASFSDLIQQALHDYLEVRGEL